jgi:two-component system NtrC family sensor kinase
VGDTPVKITQTIAFRLFLLIASIQMVILAALTFATVRLQETQLMDNVLTSATRISDLIARSTRYSMLLNRKEDVHNIISSVGGESGIEGIRIYNKQGEVIFSTDASEVNSRADLTAEACVSCHSESGLETPHPSTEDLSRIFSKPSGERILGMITPIRNEGACSNADCHAHPMSKTILGVLDVKMSLSQVDRRIVESRNRLLLFSAVAVLLISLISGGFIWVVVHRPVKRLTHGMKKVSAGELRHQLASRSTDELGELAETFNRMTDDLAKAEEQNRAWANTLEQKVKEKTEDLERAHARMVLVERMASLGNLAATVAHELNNPLEGILTFARLLIKKIRKADLPEEQAASMIEDLKLVAEESHRSGNIVKNLLVFARQKGGAFQQTALKPIMDRCAMLINHHAKINAVKLETTCADDVVLECDPNQIQQALIALTMNGVEAIAGNRDPGRTGELRLSGFTTDDGQRVVLRVSDSGVGMTEEVKTHIFEPFFTTKSEGKGVGLGLAIVFGIVERHHGRIDVQSAPGKGATFILTLPVKQPRDEEYVPLQTDAGGADS